MAWASWRAAATERRTRPHRSTSYDMSSDRSTSPLLPVFAPEDTKGWFAELRMMLGPRLAESVG